MRIGKPAMELIRFATSWATTMEDTQKLIQILEKINKRKNQ